MHNPFLEEYRRTTLRQCQLQQFAILVEIDKVCTPKGVTIAGINAMEHAGFTSAVMKGMMGSYNKIVK